MTLPTHRLIAAAIVAFCISVSGRVHTDQTFAQDNGTPDAFSYDTYAEVLEQHVNDAGMVDYAKLKANRKALDKFVASLGELPRANYEAWSDDGKLAFLINAYNAITLQKIVDHYPIKSGGIIASLRFPENSIRQIDGVWDTLTTPVLGESMTLDHIEHEIIRKEFDEPRIHVALVCAAMGCPKLRNEPYLPARLDEQLADQSRHFLDQPDKFRIDREDKTVYLSSIFKWYGADFVNQYSPASGFGHLDDTESAVAAFAATYLPPESAQFLRESEYDIVYLDYDWSLNTQ